MGSEPCRRQNGCLRIRRTLRKGFAKEERECVMEVGRMLNVDTSREIHVLYGLASGRLKDIPHILVQHRPHKVYEKKALV